MIFIHDALSYVRRKLFVSQYPKSLKRSVILYGELLDINNATVSVIVFLAYLIDETVTLKILRIGSKLRSDILSFCVL